MGYISSLVKSDRYIGVGSSSRGVRQAVDSGRNRWREAFHNKEESHTPVHPKVVPGGTYGRSSLSSDASIVRLVQAMRSMAPGGWSDDRWEQSRHFVGITYAAIHRIGEQLAQSEFGVYVKDDNHQDGKRPVKKTDPGWDLIKILEKPNNDDTFGELLYNINLQMDLTGMALTWMVPNKLGVPMELYVVPTSIAIPQPAINPDFPDGYYRIQPVYPYGPFSSYPTPTSAVGAPIPAQWMLRIKYPHPILRYDGYSPQTAMRLHLDEIEQMDRSRWYNMKRGISPSAVLQFDKENAQPLPEEEIERIRAEMENTFQGPENAGQFYVATPGAKLEPWGNKPIDMDYQSGWDQLVSFVLGAGFGITKPAAGMIEDASYSTLFATLKQLHLITLGPKCNRIAAKLTRHLAPFYGEDLIIEIKTQRIDDHEVLNGKLAQLAGNRAITINELRKALDWPLTDEQWGKERVGEPPQPPGMEGMPPGGAPGEGGMGGLEALMGGGMPPGEEQLQEGVQAAEGMTGPPLPPELEEPQEVTQSRPLAGKLGLGALGPRMKSTGNFYKETTTTIKTAEHTNKEIEFCKKELRKRYKHLTHPGTNGNGRL